MPKLNTILADVRTLSDNDEQSFNEIGEIITHSPYAKNLTQEVKESRFSKGKVYPHCSSEMVVRNGKYRSKQRYICKSRKKTFSDFTFTLPVLV